MSQNCYTYTLEYYNENEMMGSSGILPNLAVCHTLQYQILYCTYHRQPNTSTDSLILPQTAYYFHRQPNTSTDSLILPHPVLRCCIQHSSYCTVVSLLSDPLYRAIPVMILPTSLKFWYKHPLMRGQPSCETASARQKGPSHKRGTTVHRLQYIAWSVCKLSQKHGSITRMHHLPCHFDFAELQQVADVITTKKFNSLLQLSVL